TEIYTLSLHDALPIYLVPLGIVDDDVPDLLADLRAAGLAHRDHVPPHPLEALGEAGDLGGLPAALGALEGDEFAGVRCLLYHGRRGWRNSRHLARNV